MIFTQMVGKNELPVLVVLFFLRLLWRLFGLFEVVGALFQVSAVVNDFHGIRDIDFKDFLSTILQYFCIKSSKSVKKILV